MTNAEKYKDEIRAQEYKTGNWAVDKNTGEIMNCLYCAECLFCSDCYDTKIEWLVSEYKERKEFTEDEQKFMELLDKVEWVARESNGDVWGHLEKPYKNSYGNWCSDDGIINLTIFSSLPFAAIKSTDTEPTSRAEILGEKR